MKLSFHYDIGAEHADILLPTRAYAEEESTYVNTAGNAQLTAKAVPGPHMARSSWHIIQALHQKLGGELNLTSRDDIQLPSKERENQWVPIPDNQDFWSTHPSPLRNVIVRHSPTWVKAQSTLKAKGS